jgi:hypothetical protein
MLRLAKDEDADGCCAVTLDTGEVVGQFDVFDIHLLQAPECLANARLIPGPASSRVGAPIR